jgi:hypothetical protein
MFLLMPCYSIERLEATATLHRADGSLVGSAMSSADRRFLMHVTGIWLWPAVFPSLPAYLRFSTNTYRNLLPQIGELLVEDMRTSLASSRAADYLAEGFTMKDLEFEVDEATQVRDGPAQIDRPRN